MFNIFKMEQKQFTFYYGFEHHAPVSKLIIDTLQEWQKMYTNVQFVVVILSDYTEAIEMLGRWKKLSLKIIDQKDYPYMKSVAIRYNEGKLFYGNSLVGTIDDPNDRDVETRRMIDNAIKNKNKLILDNSIADLTTVEIVFKLKRDEKNHTLAENIKTQMIEKLKRELNIYKATIGDYEATSVYVKYANLKKLKNSLYLDTDEETKRQTRRSIKLNTLTEVEKNKLRKINSQIQELKKKIELIDNFFESYSKKF